MRVSIVAVPSVVLVTAIISGCAGVGSPDAYQSELSYAMFKRDLGSQIGIFSEIDVPVAADCVAAFNRGMSEKFRIDASWTGACSNGRAEGPGTMRFKEYEHGKNGDRTTAVVVEGVAAAGKCASGTATTTNVSHALALRKISSVRVFRCDDDRGRPRSFVSYPDAAHGSKSVGEDEFATLSPLSIDFLRTTFPEYHMKGITYNPDFTASAIFRSVAGNPLVTEALNVAGDVAEKKAAEKREKNAAEAYERHISGPRPNTMAHYEEGARLLNEKNKAESDRKKAATKLARAREFEAPNREIGAAERSRGTRAPAGRSCLAKYDEARLDRQTRELLERDREADLRYINLCRDVRIDVFLCLYRASSEPTSPGQCPGESETTVSYENTYEYHIDPAFRTRSNELTARAFCPAGSRPIGFKAFDSTQTNGIASYECVWN